LRIPVDKLAELRRLAEERHLTPSALMRSWVLERLAQESSGESLLAVVRKAVRDALADIRSTSPARHEPASTAHDHTSTAPDAQGRKSSPLKRRRVGAPTPKSRKSQSLGAKNRKSATSD